MTTGTKDTRGHDLYLRYLFLLEEAVPVALKAVIKKEVNERGRNFDSLVIEKKDIFNKHHNEVFLQLFQNDEVNANIDLLDTRSLCVVVLVLFEDDLATYKLKAIAWIRDQRKDLDIYAQSAALNYITFQTKWDELHSTLLELIKEIDDEVKFNCKRKIFGFQSISASFGLIEKMQQTSDVSQHFQMAIQMAIQDKIIAETVFTEMLQDTCVFLDEPVILTCRLNVSEKTVTWRHEYKPVEETDTVAVINKKCAHWLAISHAKLEDAGNYLCACGNSSTSACLKVLEKPLKITKCLHVATPEADVRENMDIVLSCEVNRYTNEAVWQHNGQVIKPCNRRVVSIDYLEHKLTIRNANFEDDGDYTIAFADDTSRIKLIINGNSFSHKIQLSDELYKNWIRGALSLKYFKIGLERFSDTTVSKHHSEILTRLPTNANTCTNCTEKLLLPLHAKGNCPNKSKCLCLKKPHKRKLCPNGGFCSAFHDQILADHRFNDPLLQNTDIQKWSSDSWSVATCYISTPGYKGKTSAKDVDCAGLLSIFINNTFFHTSLGDVLIDGKTDLFKQAREARNDILHNANYELSESQLHDYIDLFIKTLEIRDINGRSPLSNLPDVKEAIKRLNEVRDKQIEVLVTEDLQRQISELHEHAMGELANNVQDAMKQSHIKIQLLEEKLTTPFELELNIRVVGPTSETSTEGNQRIYKSMNAYTTTLSIDADTPVHSTDQCVHRLLGYINTIEDCKIIDVLNTDVSVNIKIHCFSCKAIADFLESINGNGFHKETIMLRKSLEMLEDVQDVIVSCSSKSIEMTRGRLVNWLDHAKTLREQGINRDEETLLLRRDPVQLNLLFIQTKDAILNRTHPLSQEQAIELAGIQCQIQFGDYNKHKPGTFENKEFLPKEYCKVKGIEKTIFQEHRTWAGYSERDAKVKYIQKCRALKTYGITFFLVKEKVKGKNKFVPRLLGINKESLVRVDEKTKEIMKTWPLNIVRRYAASPNSFTLDFGDYADQYYSVQTQEGEQIAALIAGYIDINLRKKKAKDHLGIEGDDDALMYEENVSSAKATIISHLSHNVSHPQTGSVSIPGVMRDGGGGESQISMGSMQQAMFSMQSNQAHAGQAIRQSQTFQEHGLTQTQRALVLTIDDGLSAVNQAQTELDQKIDLPDLGSDAASRKWKENNLDLSRQKVSAQLSAMNAATAQLVTLTGNDEPDYGAVGASVNQISSNLGDFTRDIRMLAALQEEDNSREKLMDAARRLAGGLSDLLNSVQPERREPRRNVLNAASRVGEASHDVMDGVGETATDMDKAYQDALIGLAEAVANATAQLVLKAKTVASTTEDQEMQNRVISSATSCALATSQLVACTKVIAPIISSQACQEQLIESAKMVAQSVDGVVDQAAAVSQDEKLLRDLEEAVTSVTQALNDLLKHIKLGAGPARASESQEEAVDTILNVTDRLFSSVGDAHEMVKQARQLAQATSMLVNTIRGQAESHPDSDVQKRLLAAAKALADATAKMVEAAKGCASSPNDSDRQQQLRTAAEELRSATNIAASNALKKKLVQRLVSAAKNAATASTQLINAAGSANKTHTNKTSQHDLEVQCKAVNEELSTFVQGFRGVANNCDSARAQLTLLKAAQEFVQPANALVNAANAAAPTVTDQAAATKLHWSVKSMSAPLAELRTASSKAQEVLGSMELGSALEEVQELDRELIEMKQSANDGTLRPLPGETVETCGASLGANSKKVGSAMAQLLTAAAQGNDNYVGIVARDKANALRVFVNAARGVAANSKDKQEQQLTLDIAREVIAKSNQLLEAASDVIDNPNKPDNQQRLQQVAKAVSYSLDTCVNCLPGQRDADIAIRQITETS